MPGTIVRRLVRGIAWIAASLAVALMTAWWLIRPAEPDPFYAPPAEASSTPGILLRREPFDRRVPPGARAWRMLYTTTNAADRPAVASALVLVSGRPAGAPRPVIAWTHGTTGVVPGCAPSLLNDPFAYVPALQPLLDEGWIYVATDYVGQGTPGPHPYLIGEGEARSALDSVRAVRRMADLGGGTRTVVWGHSQGGHAALWTGIIAPVYAPDVPLAGVAAVAPASDLRGLLDVVQHTPIGRIMSSYVVRAYSEAYADVSFDEYVSPWTWPLARDMASRCLEGRQALLSIATSLVAGGTMFRQDPTRGALGTRLAQNTPDRPLPQPVLIAQGLADDLVLPDVQRRFVRQRCAAGQVVAFRGYEGLDHLSVVAPDSPLTGDLLQWTRDRIAGSPAPAACREDVIPRTPVRRD
jgi:alpha-beta hydrolase superfamily lysophospholipase